MVINIASRLLVVAVKAVIIAKGNCELAFDYAVSSNMFCYVPVHMYIKPVLQYRQSSFVASIEHNFDRQLMSDFVIDRK